MEGETLESEHTAKQDDTQDSAPVSIAQETPTLLTEEEKAERLKRAEDRIKQRRLEIQEEERKKDVEREKARRRDGQDLTKIKAEMEWREAQKIAEQKKREKREDRLARQRILDEIARDRATMKAKASNKTTSEQNVAQQSHPKKPTPSSSDNEKPKKDYNQARLQIRLPDNTKLIQNFGADEPLSAVRVHIDLNSGGKLGPYIDLSTPYPRKTFSDDEMQMSLRMLGLVPSAVILATKSKVAGSAI